MVGCGKFCEQSKNDVIQPTWETKSYLDTNPTGRELAENGCGVILENLEKIPASSQQIQEFAQKKYSHVKESCLNWMHSERLICSSEPYYPSQGARPHPSRRRVPPSYSRNSPYYHGYFSNGYYRGRDCYWTPYSYCTEWKVNEIKEPGYAEALALSSQLDSMYDLAHQMCAEAELGNLQRAYSMSRDLHSKIVRDVKPSGTKMYERACGSLDLENL